MRETAAALVALITREHALAELCTGQSLGPNYIRTFR